MADGPRVALSTVRHLKPVQVAGRLRRILLPLREVPPARGVRGLHRRVPELPSVLEDGGFDGRSFSFLNRRLPFEGNERWSAPGAEALWVYTLHYFRYLHALPPAEGLSLMRDWMACNVDPASAGWDPYPTALRIREWLEWLEAHPEAPDADREAILRSLASQTEALKRRLEYHLLGNHILEDAISLCWAGLSLEADGAGSWLDVGARLLERELARQVLEDGTHEERSPMYQAFLAEGLLRLRGVAASSVGSRAEAIADLSGSSGRRLVRSLAHLVHPDGDYALLNDCSLKSAPSLGQLAARFGIGASIDSPEDSHWALPQAGYLGWRARGGNYFVFDVGPIGPDHQPGHGHADALSFELSTHGRRLLTDTGVFSYERGASRMADRGTAAHNTAEIDGRNQSEVWASFRCGRRVRPAPSEVSAASSSLSISGGYDGPGLGIQRISHTRRWTRRASAVQVRDEVRAPGRHSAVLRLHCAPGIRPSRTSAGWDLLEGETPLARLGAAGFEWALSESPYHPEFGREVRRACMETRVEFENTLSAEWRLDLLD